MSSAPKPGHQKAPSILCSLLRPRAMLRGPCRSTQRGTAGGGRLFVLLSPPELRLETNVSVLVLFPAERSCRPESRAWKHSPERRDARGPHPARFLPGRLPLLPAPASTGRSGLLAPRCRRSASVPEGTPAKQHAHPADPFGNNPWSALLPPSLSGFRGLKAVLFLACRGFCVFAIDVSPKLLVLCLG